MYFLLILPFFFSAAFAQFPAIRWDKVVSGLRQPTHAASARDGSNRLFVVEQAGLVKIFSSAELLPTPFLDIRSRVNFGGELGLLSIAFPPYFSEKQYFYVYYIDKDNATVLSRFRVSGDPNVADAATESVILRLPQPFGQHNGGLMAFSPLDGMLYLGTGDGGYDTKGTGEFAPDPLNNGQRVDTLLGKMLRIDTESGVAPYAIPDSNPKLPGGLPEIWATGCRNPWRFSFDRLTGDLYIGDVGNNAKEEINFEPAGAPGGRNYGWSVREGSGCPPESPCPDVPNLTPPILEYGREDGCSVIGGVVYRGAKYPALQGTYLFGDFCNVMIWGLRQTPGGWRSHSFGEADGLVVGFTEDEDGEVYLVDYEGSLLRLALADPPASVEPEAAKRAPRRAVRAKP